MAFETFSFTKASPQDADVYESDPIAIAAGEAVRVRFTDFSGALAKQADIFLVIDANSTESVARIDDNEAWASGAVAEGDQVRVRVKFDGALGTVAGIIEGFAS